MQEGEGELSKNQITQHHVSRDNILGQYTKTGGLGGVMDELLRIAC